MGGINGIAYDAEFSDVSVTNSVINTTGESAGGISGYFYGHLINSYSTSTRVMGGTEVGGLVGEFSAGDKGTVRNVYSTNWVKGDYYVGGITGINGTGVVNSYNSGYVDGKGYVGGLVGISQPSQTTLTNSYYDTDISNQYDHITGKPISSSMFSLSGTFDDSWHINGTSDSAQPWVQSEDGGRPYLYNQKVAISNGGVLENSLTSYVSTAEIISSRGVRYAKVSIPDDWTEIKSTVITTGKDVIEIDELEDDTLYYVQSYVEVDGDIYHGEQVYFTRFTVNTPPTVLNVEIEVGGDDIVEILLGKYEYNSLSNTPESASIYKWYRSDDILGGNKTVIIDAIDKVYTIDNAIDQGKYLTFEVTPNNGTALGETVQSAPYFIIPLEGNGTESHPYKISSLSDLELVSENPREWDKYFIQTADIDAIDTKNWNGGLDFLPIGNGTTQFTGQYNGDDFSIKNLFINRSTNNDIGLFGYLNNAIVENIHLVEANITGLSQAGGIFGKANGSTGMEMEIRNVSVRNSTISGGAYNVGGIGGNLSGGSLINS